jgi:hypothetical protein
MVFTVSGTRSGRETPVKPLSPQIAGLFEDSPADVLRRDAFVKRLVARQAQKQGPRIVLDNTTAEGVMKNVVGQCGQRSTGNCYQVAFLNSMTTSPEKAKRFLQVIRPVDKQNFLVTLRSKWSQEPITIPVNLEKMAKDMDEFCTHGPLYARIYEYARALHEMQPVPLPYQKGLINFLVHEKSQRYQSLKEALEGAGSGFRALTGKPLETKLFKNIGVADELDKLAPELDRITLTANGQASVIRTVTGKPYRVLGAHAYSVLDIDPTTQSVVILNPHWGSRPETLSYREFEKGFCLFDIGRLP